MIMKKFEALEQLEKKSDKTAEGPLNETDLEQLFKLTSNFTIDSMLGQTEFDDIDFGSYDEWDFLSDEYLTKLTSSEHENIFDSDDEGEFEQKKRGRLPGMKGVKKDKQRVQSIMVPVEITGVDGFVYTIKKRVRTADPSQPIYTRIPGPVPTTWARRMRELVDATPQPGSRYFEADVLKTEWLPLVNDRKYQAILMDPPWKSEDQSEFPFIQPSDLKLLQKALKLLCPEGLIFMWTEKQYLSETLKVMARLGYTYVENFVWAKSTLNNKLVQEKGSYFNSSKLSLLIFRATTKGPLELRHQRNPGLAKKINSQMFVLILSAVISLLTVVTCRVITLPQNRNLFTK